jgi:hypothetical protein
MAAKAAIHAAPDLERCLAPPPKVSWITRPQPGDDDAMCRADGQRRNRRHGRDVAPPSHFTITPSWPRRRPSTQRPIWSADPHPEGVVDHPAIAG